MTVRPPGSAVVDGLRDRLTTAEQARDAREELAQTYRALVDAAVRDPDDPSVLELLRDQLRGIDPSIWDRMDNRPRTLFRLVAAGADRWAWASLLDGAGWRGPTSASAASVTAGAEPAYVHVDDGRVFAWLPGFRDPRGDAPEECYDLTDSVTLRASVDDLRLTSRTLTLGGIAVLSRGVTATADDVLTLALADDGDGSARVRATRHRRPDLVSGVGSRLTRQAWSGWSATIDLSALPRASGRWRVTLSIDSAGVRKTSAVRPEPESPARHEVGATVRRGLRVYQLRADATGLLLVGRRIRPRDLTGGRRP